MEDNVTIPKEFFPYVIPAFKEKLVNIENKIAELKEERKQIEQNIAYINDLPVGEYRLEIHSYDVNNPPLRKGTMFSKIVDILMYTAKPMTTGEITNQILKAEPDRVRITTNRIISSVLITKSKQGLLQAIKGQGKWTKYTLP